MAQDYIHTIQQRVHDLKNVPGLPSQAPEIIEEIDNRVTALAQLVVAASSATDRPQHSIVDTLPQIRVTD